MNSREPELFNFDIEKIALEKKFPEKATRRKNSENALVSKKLNV
jgi:hypothetical protein